jgi:glycosyltransferase involved in cell wall biosynthesis
MTPSPTITTVLTTYRRPQFLGRAIRSVLNQTYPNFHLAVYDNASDEATRQVVYSFAKSDSRVHYVPQPVNLGTARNYQFGIDRVNTPYYSLLADDDILLPEFFEKSLDALNANPDALFSIGLTLFGGWDRKPYPCTTAGFRPGLYRNSEGLLEFVSRPQPPWIGVLFRNEVRSIVGPLDTELFSIDYDYLLRAAASCPYVVHHHPTAMFTIHPASSTATLRLHMVWPTRYAAMEKVINDERIDRDVRDRVRRILSQDFGRLLLMIGFRALTLGYFDEAEQTAEILERKLDESGKGRLLRIARRAVEYCGPARHLLTHLHAARKSWRTRREDRLSTGLDGYFEYYRQLGDPYVHSIDS